MQKKVWLSDVYVCVHVLSWFLFYCCGKNTINKVWNRRKGFGGTYSFRGIDVHSMMANGIAADIELDQQLRTHIPIYIQKAESTMKIAGVFWSLKEAPSWPTFSNKATPNPSEISPATGNQVFKCMSIGSFSFKTLYFSSWPPLVCGHIIMKNEVSLNSKVPIDGNKYRDSASHYAESEISKKKKKSPNEMSPLNSSIPWNLLEVELEKKRLEKQPPLLYFLNAILVIILKVNIIRIDYFLW